MEKISRTAFENAIRAKMLEPKDIIDLIVVEDEDCAKCQLCGFLTPEPASYNGKVLCTQCLLGEVENPELALKRER